VIIRKALPGKKNEILSKVLSIMSDIVSKDLIYSMENFVNSSSLKRYFSLVFFICIPIVGFSFVETKRFDAKPTPRAKYLVNTRPQTLRYTDPVVIADRRALLSLTSLQPVLEPVVEQNASKKPEIPLIAYGQDEISIFDEPIAAPNNANPMNEDSSVLPAPDPFSEDEASSSINSTDDLLDLFEQTNRNQIIAPGYNSIPFIPPFTSAPDNLRVESSASYRKVRK
jgi:hypothetical protein